MTLLLLFPWAVPQARGASGEIPLPPELAEKNLGDKTDSLEIANCFLRIPYRDDGTVDEFGRWTLLARPDRFFTRPGLNCSGLLVSLGRFLLGKNFTLDEVNRDALGDSGPDSKWGKNWDYGWDLIMNLSLGLERRVIMPDGYEPVAEVQGAENQRGFDLQDDGMWSSVLPRMEPGRFYPFSISKARGRGWLHYHVGLFLADGRGKVWLYQSTRTGNAYRAEMTSPAGMRRFKEAFRRTRTGVKKILILEVPLPEHSRP
ncbi:MAG: hypothetical protein KKB20_14655 [Proteobacteria bacterium]|nr:hypothetical protein [Pseudomonadota bacterium]